jgi:hypothetical protein
MSRFVSDVEWPKKARWVVYPVTWPPLSTTRAVPCEMACPQLDGTVEAMNAARERVAGILVGRCCGPHLASGNAAFASLSLQAGERLADVEAERGI